MKKHISLLMRRLGIIRFTDYLLFQYNKQRNETKNKAFLQKNPGIVLPPDYMMYESFQLDYDEYFTKSQETASWLLGYFKKHISIDGIKILDWGCGPGRIIRHMPALLDEKSEIFGTDYNPKTIEWCQKNLPGIDFRTNTLKAHLSYEDNYFDVVFGISIFTHLSEKMHFEWANELMRILKPGGILLLTTHGENFIVQLSEIERKKFLNGELIVRGNTVEGHRTFGAYHPVEFMQKLFGKLKVMEHVVTKTTGKKPQQDIWIFQKPF